MATQSQIVIVHNTAEKVTHFVMDKDGRGHELRPGQRKSIDMKTSDIEAFRRQRTPGRKISPNDPYWSLPGKMPADGCFPLHPIVIEGVSEEVPPEPVLEDRPAGDEAKTGKE